MFVYIICVQLFKNIWNSNMVQSMGDVPPKECLRFNLSVCGSVLGVFEGQFISLWECVIFIYENRFHI